MWENAQKIWLHKIRWDERICQMQDSSQLTREVIEDDESFEDWFEMSGAVVE